MISDLKTHLPKCQENLILKPSLYLFCYMYNSFRHKLNSFRQRFIQLLTSHVTSGHLRSQHCSRQGILCSMTSNCIQLIVSQIATESLSALVKETELLRIRQTVNANLPFQDHLIMLMLLGLASVNPQQKDQAEELFPSTIEVGFQLKCSLQNVLSFYPQICGTEQLTPPFCETATSRTDQVYACFCKLYSYLCYFYI